MELLKTILGLKEKLTGYRTFFAGAGLIGLGVYQLSTGLYDQGVETILAGIAAMSLRAAVARGTGV